MYCCWIGTINRIGKGRLQGRLNIKSYAAALRAFMRQRWYIQAYLWLLFVQIVEIK